jgi:hypothetical protein
MWESRDADTILLGKLWEGDNLEDPGVVERIILKWKFEKWHGRGGLISIPGQTSYTWQREIFPVTGLSRPLGIR